MYFEVNITPKEKAVVCPAAKEKETRFNLALAPFQPQTRIEIESPLYTTAYCSLNIKNTSNRSLNVSVTKKPAKERAILLSLSELTVEADGECELGISWTPREVGTWRDTLQLTDSRRIKYNIALITSAIGTKKDAAGRGKPKGQKSGISCSNVSSINIPNRNPKSHLQTATPKKRPEPKSFHEKSRDYVESPSKRSRPTILGKIQDKENISSNLSGWVTPKTSTSIGFGQRKVQNPSRISHDFSAIMDSTTYNLTPLQPKLSFNYGATISTVFSPEKLSSPSQGATIPTPLSTDGVLPLRRDTYVTAPVCKDITLSNEDIRGDFEDSLSPQDPQKNPKSDFSMLINGLNFTTTKTSYTPIAFDFSPKCCSSESKNGSATRHVSAHESMISLAGGNNTFNINKSSNSQIIEPNGTYELPKSPTGAMTTEHIRPTRLSRSFAMLSPVMPVDEKVPRIHITSSSPIGCDNLFTADHPPRNKSEGYHLPLGHRDSGCAQDVLEADLWAKPAIQHGVPNFKGSTASLGTIAEEQSYVDKSVTTNRTYTKELNKTDTLNTTSNSTNVRIEISPPKKLPTGKIAPIRRVSPKKSAKVSKEKGIQDSISLRKKVNFNASINKSSGKISIPGVRITKLSLAGIGRRKSHDGTTKAHKQEVSVKLHDPNDFLSRLCNPDPFAASTTEDPFLASTMYYDEKWVHNQEVEFKKWLNTLLTPPEHLSANVDTPCIDVGKVWQSCRMKEDVSLAETREAVSARYHTNTRLNTLRKATCAMFRSNEVVTVLSKVTVCVEKGILIIRQDRDLYKDIGLQKIILELFLCYNPLWLRIGLEAVYGETIPLHSNNDLVGLTRFLITRFFSDPYIVKSNSHPAVIHLRLPTFTPIMNKFMLKKFLLVVYFLDYAKKNKLIGHDPCLFHKRAVHKESREILLTFSREVLSGVGDVTKVLRPYGYILSHKQTYLDEYDYAVVDMCVDLRDGVRLCRVMELITGKRCLTMRCRVPAISRLQKVHNVDVALTALLQSGYYLLGDIDAKSIADGHKEKTLSLLWQIIYKFQAPLFNKAAATVQKWWRAMLWWVRIRNFLRKRRDNAACVIQRAWSCYLARKQLRELKETYVRNLQRKDKAARTIQLYWVRRREMMKDRKRFLWYISSAGKIQRWWKNCQATKPYVKSFQRKRNAAVAIQRRWRATRSMKSQKATYLIARDAVIKIQSWWKLTRARRTVYRHYQNMRIAANYIQAKWRGNRSMRAERERYQQRLAAVKILQRWWRSALAMKRGQTSFILMKHAVRTIESWWLHKGIVNEERKDFLLYRNSVVTIQRAWRTHQATRYPSLYLRSCKRSCIKIQAWWRGVLARREYNLKRGSSLLIQRWWRSITLMRPTRSSYLSMKGSAITIQKCWRTKMARKDYLRKKNAVLAIESWYSNVVASIGVRNNFLEIKVATKTIQRWWRDLQTSKACRINYLEYRRTIVWVQTRWHANHLSRKCRETYSLKKQSACIIQAWWRMRKQRRRYMALKKLSAERNSAAIVLQRNWRAILAGRQQREALKKLKKSVIDTQRRWRANKIARSVRTEYNSKKHAAIIIQKNWKSLIASRNFNRKKNAATVIQSHWRSKRMAVKELNSFLSLKTAAVRLQRRFRANKARRDYINLRNHVVVVQRRWRAMRIGRTLRHRFVVQRNAAILIQSKWKMIRDVREYTMKRRAAISIQSWWRSVLATRKAQSFYQSLRSITIFAQRRYRSKKLCEATMQKYNNLRRNVILVQRRRRAQRLMRVEREQFVIEREAAVKIQRWWRTVLAMRECQNHYETQRTSAITIQRWYRAKQKYATYVTSIVKIQRWWRQILYEKYLALKLQAYEEAVAIIERWWLNVLEERAIQNACAQEFKRKVSAATLIQAVWRGHKLRRTQSDEFKKLRQRSEKATAEAQPTDTLAHRLDVGIILLQGYDSLGKLNRGLSALDFICRILPKGCMELCKANLVDKIYEIFYRSNRSLPWMDINWRAASILVTLAKFPPTKPYVWQEKHVEIIIRLLLVTVEREVDLFLHLATLLWLLAENPKQAEAILSHPTTVRTLNAIHNTVTKKRSRLSSVNSSMREQLILLPNPKPDWGLRHSRPRLFTTVHHAIATLCRRLKINPSS